MSAYFSELGLGFIVYLYFIFPVVSIFIGIILFVILKRVWISTVVTLVGMLSFFLWYMSLSGLDMRGIVSSLPIILIYTGLSFLSSWLCYKKLKKFT